MRRLGNEHDSIQNKLGVLCTLVKGLHYLLQSCIYCVVGSYLDCGVRYIDC